MYQITSSQNTQELINTYNASITTHNTTLALLDEDTQRLKEKAEAMRQFYLELQATMPTDIYLSQEGDPLAAIKATHQESMDILNQQLQSMTLNADTIQKALQDAQNSSDSSAKTIEDLKHRLSCLK